MSRWHTLLGLILRPGQSALLREPMVAAHSYVPLPRIMQMDSSGHQTELSAPTPSIWANLPNDARARISCKFKRPHRCG